MRESILILGGARSGKSGYAMKLAKEFSGKVALIATADSYDEEMKKRIEKHKESRPKHWKVIEESKNIRSILENLNGEYEVVIIDCMGMLVSNLLSEGLNSVEIQKKIKAVVNAVEKSEFITILISNEVGMGIVPGTRLGRRFRDLIGLVNQIAAEKADKVIFMKAGIPTIIKGSE